MCPVIDHADQQEERPCGEPVVDHLDDRPLDSFLGHRKDPEHDKSQVGYRGIGHQLFDVRLHHGDQRTVDDADDSQHGEQRRESKRCIGEQRQTEP
jgi:hypothetical protein